MATLNEGQARTNITNFIGLNQYGNPLNGDPRYASESRNMETIGGMLQPCAACTLLTPPLDHPIETLARLYRRWYATEAEKEVLIAASDGQLYALIPGDTPAPTVWTLLDLPDGWAGTEYVNNHWSWVAYEIPPEGEGDPVDVLLLSNADDGMILVRGDDLTTETVTTPKKFGVIARYAERIWGGAIPDDPDMLMYSAPYDPLDWTADIEIPEDGAGEINQPSWDGDSFTALHQFGQQLIAFKRTRIWRILGTDPGEYAFKEQYGGGAPFYRTVAVDGERIFMLGTDGVRIYDGAAVQPFYQQFAYTVFQRMKQTLLDGAFGCVWNNKYYLAIPLDSTATANNAVLIYDAVENTWLLRDDVAVEAFLPTESALYYTSAATPGRIWQWQEDSWTTGTAAASCEWVTPWTDLGFKNCEKSGLELYVTVEVAAAATLTFTVQTEKKSKIKTYAVALPATGKSAKQKLLRFGGSFRMFRLKISSTTTVPWRIIGGLQLLTELDAD